MRAMHEASEQAWRVAVVGSGPSAFYAAEALLKHGVQRVDMFERLPVPFGLVRGGVAPDHQNIKGVVKVYEKVAEQPQFRFFGNVRVGRDVQVGELAAAYHQIVYAFGCESDTKLGVPGEDLHGVHSATEFVGWYNAHPDFRDRTFDLSRAHRVALVGNGNVAMDVARVLLSSPDRLANTDIADYALETLRQSRVREVVLLGRRGPAQAAFSPKEIEEIAELPEVDVVVTPDEAKLDELSTEWLEHKAARSQQRNVKFLQQQVERGEGTQAKKLRCRFLVAPTELHGEAGRLQSVTVQHMQLVAAGDGTPRPKARGSSEEIAADLLFKAIGYRGVPLNGVPFDEGKGIVPNVEGRVVEAPGGAVRTGHYAVGWCKRGPTGLIGTNSPDAKATVEAMKADRDAGKVLRVATDDVAALLKSRNVDVVDWPDWQRFDAWERRRGEALGKLRHKLADVAEMMRTIRELRSASAPS
jgi:ferredoxin--NADP+ reductase